MAQQIIKTASVLKEQLKKIKKENKSIRELQDFYQAFKSLLGMIEQTNIGEQKLPSFFSQMHNTTVDMRLQLMAELDHQRSINTEMREKIAELMAQIRDKDLQAKTFQNTQHQKQILVFQNERKVCFKQLQQLKKQNEALKTTCNKQYELEKSLRGQISSLQQKLKNPKPGRRTSLTPDHAGQASYENVLGSFTESPQNRDYTQMYENSQITEAKPKSLQPGRPAGHSGFYDEIWRLLFLQASSIEQFIQRTQ